MSAVKSGPPSGRRKHWLKILFSSVTLAVVMLLADTLIDSWREYHRLSHIPGRVEVFIGVYPDFVQGQKASLLNLSKEMDRHPHADVFVIRRSDTLFATEDIDWWETVYDRRRHTIVDGNVWAGDTASWGSVSDMVAKRVAMATDGFQGFGRSGCTDVLP